MDSAGRIHGTPGLRRGLRWSNSRNAVYPSYTHTGSAGKITNCQIGVSLSVATRTEHVPVDFELYLPESWTEDPARRKEARIPDSIQFQTKPQLGIAMVRRAIADGLPRGVVLADSAYGSSSEFRQELRELGLDYSLKLPSRSSTRTRVAEATR